MKTITLLVLSLPLIFLIGASNGDEPVLDKGVYIYDGTQPMSVDRHSTPEVVDWNRGPLGERSGNPLDDPRTRVHVGDVAKLLRSSSARFDVIALDVDNGPDGLTKRANDWLYSTAGIAAAQDALSPSGILAYWSAGPDQAFHDRLRRCGFMVEEVNVYAHGRKGARHTIWLASVDG